MAPDIILNKNFGLPPIVVGPGWPVAVVAEAGVLTFGEKETGFRFVDEAKKAGIKLLKFQSMNPENVVSAIDQFWLNRLKQRALSKEDFLAIMEYGKSQGVTCFATTHNEYDLVDLAKRGMPLLKLGSGDSNNFRMIDLALTSGKPVIVSWGLLTKEEIVKLLARYKNYSDQIIFLHCTTIYPTPPRLANLGILPELKEQFPDYNFGYSDHVAGPNVSLAASVMPEVTLIEKHFCLPEHRTRPKFESLDILAALTPDEFGQMLGTMEQIYQATREFKEDPQIWENKKWAHKAICARVDLLAGQILAQDDLMSIRPYYPEQDHISIADFDLVVGKKIKRDLKKGEHLLKSDLI